LQFWLHGVVRSIFKYVSTVVRTRNNFRKCLKTARKIGLTFKTPIWPSLPWQRMSQRGKNVKNESQTNIHTPCPHEFNWVITL
jgi:hypothetical protein